MAEHKTEQNKGIRNVSIEIKLPEHLAEFLQKISYELDMDPGQFLAKILEYYYKVYDEGWNEGIEHGRDECEECPSDDE